jgi:hypothetical protein
MDEKINEPTKFLIMYYANGLWIVALIDTLSPGESHRSFIDKESALAFVAMLTKSLEVK